MNFEKWELLSGSPGILFDIIQAKFEKVLVNISCDKGKALVVTLTT